MIHPDLTERSYHRTRAELIFDRESQRTVSCALPRGNHGHRGALSALLLHSKNRPSNSRRIADASQQDRRAFAHRSASHIGTVG